MEKYSTIQSFGNFTLIVTIKHTYKTNIFVPQINKIKKTKVISEINTQRRQINDDLRPRTKRILYWGFTMPVNDFSNRNPPTIFHKHNGYINRCIGGWIFDFRCSFFLFY